MQLLTNELKAKLPKLYATENEKDPICYIKFFTPDSSWSWYVTEFDGIDRFFGYVCGLSNELGYFSLAELESTTGAMGLHIERDISFTPTKLSLVKRLCDD
jgi:hypothetical protein